MDDDHSGGCCRRIGTTSWILIPLLQVCDQYFSDHIKSAKMILPLFALTSAKFQKIFVEIDYIENSKNREQTV